VAGAVAGCHGRAPYGFLEAAKDGMLINPTVKRQVPELGPMGVALILARGLPRGAAKEGRTSQQALAAGARAGGDGRQRASAARHAPRPRHVRAAAVAALGGQPAAAGRGRRRVRRRIRRARCRATWPPLPVDTCACRMPFVEAVCSPLLGSQGVPAQCASADCMRRQL